MSNFHIWRCFLHKAAIDHHSTKLNKTETAEQLDGWTFPYWNPPQCFKSKAFLVSLRITQAVSFLWATAAMPPLNTFQKKTNKKGNCEPCSCWRNRQEAAAELNSALTLTSSLALTRLWTTTVSHSVVNVSDVAPDANRMMHFIGYHCCLRASKLMVQSSEKLANRHTETC